MHQKWLECRICKKKAIAAILFEACNMTCWWNNNLKQLRNDDESNYFNMIHNILQSINEICYNRLAMNAASKFLPNISSWWSIHPISLYFGIYHCFVLYHNFFFLTSVWYNLTENSHVQIISPYSWTECKKLCILILFLLIIILNLSTDNIFPEHIYICWCCCFFFTSISYNVKYYWWILFLDYLFFAHDMRKSWLFGNKLWI